jgi:transcription-repair coupling factor (superfamily II helicase)
LTFIDAGTKMRIYRRLLLARENEEIEAIKAELIDRFGIPPRPVENFLQVAQLRLEARNKNIKGLRRRGSIIEIQTTETLPVSLNQKIGKMKLKRVNDYTLKVQLADKASLEDLQAVLDRI